MTLVSTVTVGAGGAASIEWTGISGTATDLLVVASLRDTNGGTGMNTLIRLNGDTASNYNTIYLAGTGSAASSGAIAPGGAIYAGKHTGGGDTASTFGSFQIYIPNYASSSAKSASSEGVEENNATAAFQWMAAGNWTGTAAVTTLTIVPTSNFAQYSTASLYTITKGSGGATVS